MSITNESAKWEWKNSWYMLLEFIFPLNFIPFFMMYSRLPKKKYLVKGFICIVAGLFMFLSIILSDSVISNYSKEYPESPYVGDYLGDDYYSIPDYQETAEYKEYQKDLDEYFDSKEYKEVSDYNYQIYRKVNTVMSVIIPFSILFLFFLLAVIGNFVDRPEYLRELAQKKRRNIVSENYRTTDVSYRSNDRVDSNVKTDDSVVQTFDSERESSGTTMGNDQFDINTMTEEEFGKIPLLNVIDIKKIMDFREKNGSFDSKDQFFECFGAKPHVIAKLENSITIIPKKNDDTYNSFSGRRFDI